MTTESFPDAIHPEAVGSYPALVFGGGGYVWDAVLEYRVWFYASPGGDSFRPFARHTDAARFSARTRGAEEPLALVLQEEYIDEPAPGDYVHRFGPRITEWPLAFLRRSRRTPRTIPEFLAADGPARRLEILDGDGA
jgi:hypothetical protein